MAPIGAVVGLYVDLKAQVNIGDIIETESGRRYSVLGVRMQERGMHVGRQHLKCLVVHPGWLPDRPMPGAMLHPIRWYPRGKKRVRR